MVGPAVRRQVCQHAHAFNPCRADVTGELRAGENTLVVEIEASLFATADRPSKGYGMQPDLELTKRNWLRKTQSSFGWDWSTRLLNAGIRNDVSLEIASVARCDRLVALAQVSPDLQQGTVTDRLFVGGLKDKVQRSTLTVEIEGTGQKARPKRTPGLDQ